MIELDVELYRKIVIYRGLGLVAEEIAEKLDMPVNQVRNIIFEIDRTDIEEMMKKLNLGW